MRNLDSSLLDTFIDELGFVTDNVLIYIYDFIFSDDLFSSLYVIFSDEIVVVTNSVLTNTFSDESFHRKKLNLLVMKNFVVVAKFSFALAFFTWRLSSTQHIATKSNFRH